MAYFEATKSNPTFLKTLINKRADFSFPLHFHTSFELLYVSQGEIEIVVGKTAYRVEAGQLVLIPPNSAHSYHTYNHSEISILVFNFNYLPEIYEETQTGVYRNPVISDGEELFSFLREAESDPLLFRAALYRIAASYSHNEPLDAVAKQSGDFAFKLSKYVEEHYNEPLSENSVAKVMGYHPRYLSALIQNNFGISFRNLLNEYRVKAAAELLRDSEQSVTDVYLAVGFDSQSSFNRNFKAIMGITPLKYRQGYRNVAEIHKNHANP